MGNDYDEILARLDKFIVRDMDSYEELQKKHGITPELCPDLTVWHPAKPEVIGQGDGIIMTDFYSREFDCFTRPMGGRLYSLPFLEMRTMSWYEILNRVAQFECLITSRFHGIFAAYKARIPLWRILAIPIR